MREKGRLVWLLSRWLLADLFQVLWRVSVRSVVPERTAAIMPRVKIEVHPQGQASDTYGNPRGAGFAPPSPAEPPGGESRKTVALRRGNAAAVLTLSKLLRPAQMGGPLSVLPTWAYTLRRRRHSTEIVPMFSNRLTPSKARKGVEKPPQASAAAPAVGAVPPLRATVVSCTTLWPILSAIITRHWPGALGTKAKRPWASVRPFWNSRAASAGL